MTGLPLGTIIVTCCMLSGVAPPQGWKDITATPVCTAYIETFRQQYPNAGEFRDGDKLFCFEKVENAPLS